jgi:RNA polymerase sigma-70 factor, ECF subfamily
MPADGRFRRRRLEARGLVTKHREDLRLVERMREGDAEAFETFGERSFRAVYRFALSRLRGDRELAQEIVQTALTKALAKLDTYRGEAALVTWLCACCRNEILMHFRRRRAAPPLVDLDEEQAVAPGFFTSRPSDAETVLLEREGAHLVHMALDLVPQHYAQALEWMYLEDVPVKEIASRMGMEPKAAESLLTRARQAFRSTYASVRGLEV